jgi:hypothetical protein
MDNAEQVKPIGALCKQSDFSGMHLEYVQDGEI